MAIRETLKKKRGGSNNNNEQNEANEANEVYEVYQVYKECKSKGIFSKTQCKKNVIRSFNNLIGNANDDEENEGNEENEENEGNEGNEENEGKSYVRAQVRRAKAIMSPKAFQPFRINWPKNPYGVVRKQTPKLRTSISNNFFGNPGPPSGGSRKKKRTLKNKGGRPKRKQSKTRKARK